MTTPRRWPTILLVTLVFVVAAGIAAFHFATRTLKSKIEEALGPRSEVQEIIVGLTRIEIVGIRVRGDKEWPADEELSARRVIIVPDWNALLSSHIRIASIRVEDGYVSMLRRKDGKLVLLPSLLAKPGAPPAQGGGKATTGASMPEISIGRTDLANAAVDFYDASVRQPAHKLRLEQTEVHVGRVQIPALTGQTTLQVEGIAKGVQHDGKVSIKGWMELASKDSEMHARLAGVDLVAFQPYLVKAAETGVKRGTLDLDLKSTVKKKRLHAPGRVVLSGLELTGRTFMGMPRDALMKAMQSRDGRIEAEFTLDGNVDDPKFSLNEKFIAQIGIAAAGAMGISLADLVTGIGGAGGSATQGLGAAIGKLFGEKKPEVRQ